MLKQLLSEPKTILFLAMIIAVMLMLAYCTFTNNGLAEFS